MSLAFTFPGQGSQKIGMGRELSEAFASAREVFEEVDDALGQNLSRLMWQGDEEELTLTENAQPALMASSMAVIAVLKSEGGFKPADHVKFVAGHSLGEYSALAAADALSISDAAKTLRTRGKAMQHAAPRGTGNMAALLGIQIENAHQVVDEAAQDEICTIANDNAPGQVIISGHAQAVSRAANLAKQAGAKRSMLLPVSAPFHCPLMEPAAAAMQKTLSELEVRRPSTPLVANVTARPVEEPDAIKELLIQQVTDVVRWRETVLYLSEQEITTVAELGTGSVLTGLARRIDRSMNAIRLETPADIETFLQDQ